MASSIETAQRGKFLRHGQSSSENSASSLTKGLKWIPFALATAAIVAGLGRRKKSSMPFALAAVAGVVAVAAVREAQLGRGKADGYGQEDFSSGKPEVERSITIGNTVDELTRCWLDPRTLPKLMKGFVTVRAEGDGRMHWKFEGPLGRAFEWDSATIDDRTGDGIRWRSLPDTVIPNEGSVRFRPAPADRGTVVTLHLRFDPPGGALGDAAVKLLGTTPLGLAADTALRRFKSLVETGETPTTERQPAARADTR